MSTPIEIRLPDIGDFTGVPVIEVHVAPGDQVAVDDPILTLESDKATMDIPAPQAGTVRELRVGVGDEVSEGDLLMTLEAAGAPGGGAQEQVAEEATSTPATRCRAVSSAARSGCRSVNTSSAAVEPAESRPDSNASPIFPAPSTAILVMG